MRGTERLHIVREIAGYVEERVHDVKRSFPEFDFDRKTIELYKSLGLDQYKGRCKAHKEIRRELSGARNLQVIFIDREQQGAENPSPEARLLVYIIFLPLYKINSLPGFRINAGNGPLGPPELPHNRAPDKNNNKRSNKNNKKHIPVPGFLLQNFTCFLFGSLDLKTKNRQFFRAPNPTESFINQRNNM